MRGSLTVCAIGAAIWVIWGIICEGLQEKLEQISTISFDLEVRDITTRDDWFQADQYSIPVLCVERTDQEETLPRASVEHLTRLLQQYQG